MGEWLCVCVCVFAAASDVLCYLVSK
jgi:hypothetical protein